MNTQKSKWNLMDTLIVLLILALCAAAIFFLRPSFRRESTSADAQILYTVQIDSLLPEVAKKVQKDATVYDAKTNVVLGVIQSVSIAPSTYQIAGEDGQPLTLPHPEYQTVTVTISSPAVYGNHYTVNGTAIRIGTQLSLKTAHFTGVGVCTSITTV